jgi:hypothetical protein
MASLAASEEPITGGAPAEEQDDDDDEDEDDDDDDDDEDDEDPRIEKLRSYSEKHSVEETVSVFQYLASGPIQFCNSCVGTAVAGSTVDVFLSIIC